MNIGIIGSGTMGSGIAQVAAASGCNVKLFDTNEKALATESYFNNNVNFSKVSILKCLFTFKIIQSNIIFYRDILCNFQHVFQSK